MTVETLVREPEAAEAPGAPPSNGHAPNGSGPEGTPPETPVGRACPSCGAALADDQEWCLECGSATRERWTAVPGWRTAAATIAITLVLASGAVAAAYAALKSDSSSSSSAAGTAAASAQNGAPPAADPNAIPPPPPIDIPPETAAEKQAAAAAKAPPPVTPPAATPPVSTAPATPTPAPVTPTPTAPATPPASGGNSGSGSKSGGDTTPPVKRAPLEPVVLDPATTVALAYDPAARDASVFAGEPKLAFDADPATAWTVALPTPDVVSAPAVGLVVDLGKPTALRRLNLTPTTPGTTVVVYGTKDATPPTALDDPAWTKLATQLDVTGKTRITLGDDVAGTEKVRHVLIWFSAGPDDGSAAVGISELKLFS